MNREDSPMELEQYRVLARRMLSERRYEHTLAVARLAGELAAHYGADPEAAQAAGLLHDLTKEQPMEVQREILSRKTDCGFPPDRQLQTVEKPAIMFDNPLPENSNVCHALTGYLYARDKLGLEDADLLNAVRYHTTGRAGMSLLEKLVFAADKFSYDRTYSDAERLRALAFTDLNASILEFLDFNVAKLMKQRSFIDLDTIRCYNSICLE